MTDREEQEPLLGSAEGVAQEDGVPIYHNLILGSGILAQVGVWILAALVWSGIFSHKLILFSAHPLLNSAGIVLITQATLILQPTRTAEQKQLGTYIHAALVDLGVLCMLAGLIIIEVNKNLSGRAHFESPHSIMGLITYILVFLQAVSGVVQFFYPQVYGSVDNAKKMYKYHRGSGYVILALMCATVCAATWTEYNLTVLEIHHWSVITASVILLASLYARIKKQKLGL